MTAPDWVGTFFGEPWPSGVCDEGIRVDTPIGRPCALCEVLIVAGDRGNFIGIPAEPYYGPVHRECSLRSVMGGIGHITNHLRWCLEEGDPDAGLGYRRSSILVWEWISDHGFPVG